MTEPIPITEQSVTAEGTTESLRRDALRTLAVITFALGCAWVLYVAVLMNDTRPLSGLAPLGLLLVSGVTFWLPRRSLSLVSAFFPIGLLLVLLLYVLQTSGSLAPFFAPLIIKPATTFTVISAVFAMSPPFSFFRYYNPAASRT